MDPPQRRIGHDVTGIRGPEARPDSSESLRPDAAVAAKDYRNRPSEMPLITILVEDSATIDSANSDCLSSMSTARGSAIRQLPTFTARRHGPAQRSLQLWLLRLSAVPATQARGGRYKGPQRSCTEAQRVRQLGSATCPYSVRSSTDAC